MSDGIVAIPVAQLIEKFIALRAKIHEIKEAHKKQLAPYQDAYVKLEGMLMAELDRAGVTSMRGQAGTISKVTGTSVTVSDWSSTLEYIKSNDEWDLLEGRVSKTAALAVIEETGKPIPGVQVSQVALLHVRRA